MTKNWTPQQKLCVLHVNEISIKERLHYDPHKDRLDGFEELGNNTTHHNIANHASVFMVRGLCEKWKQTIGYFFTSGPMKVTHLKTLTVEAIRTLRECGLDCICLICDQGSNNQSLMRHLNVSVTHPSFHVDDKDVYVLHDTPHVLKNTRNNMKNSGYVWGGKIVSWRVIEDVYLYDQTRQIKMLDKITKKHVYLQGFGTKMRVRLAAQILSHRVAAAIETMVQVKHLQGEEADVAMATAAFCDAINSLFDVFNSHSRGGKYPLARAIQSGSPHFEYLDSCLDWLATMYVPGKEGQRQLPCIQAWQMNIHSLKAIWEYVQGAGMSYLITNRLNQDALENFFSLICAKNRQDDRPDSNRFKAAYRDLSVQSVFKLSSVSNCEEDVDHFLLGIDQLHHSDNSVTDDHTYASSQQAQADPNDPHPAAATDVIPEEVLSALVVGGADMTLDLQDTNVLVFLAGFLAKRMMTKVNGCQECRLSLTVAKEDVLADPRYTYLHKRKYAGLGLEGGLLTPSSDLLSQMEIMVVTFRKHIPLVINTANICQTIYALLTPKLDVSKLSCGTKACALHIPSFIKIYIHLRVHHIVRCENNIIAQPNFKRNRKFLKVTHVWNVK